MDENNNAPFVRGPGREKGLFLSPHGDFLTSSEDLVDRPEVLHHACGQAPTSVLSDAVRAPLPRGEGRGISYHGREAEPVWNHPGILKSSGLTFPHHPVHRSFDSLSSSTGHPSVS